MSESALTLLIPKFDENNYLETTPEVIDAIKNGTVTNAFDHYVRYGIDANLYSLLRHDAGPLTGFVDRFIVSESGFCLVIGWVADEGYDSVHFKLIGQDFSIDVSERAIFRHARSDVEAVKQGAYDYGYVAFAQSPSKLLLKQSLLLRVESKAGSFQSRIVPEIVSDKRMLDTLLEFIASCHSHAGKETVLHSFLNGDAGNSLVKLFQSHVSSAIENIHVKRFGARPVLQSFVTVLFGSTEPMMIQPVLFKSAGIDFGEWIYVCNSPELAEEVIRCGRLISGLYNVMITVIVLGDNAGFGAANNVAIAHASSDRIVIINPDAYPLAEYAEGVQRALSSDFGANLWGGLLFYDPNNLMHSGMHLEHDTYCRRTSFNGARDNSAHCDLIRVEHLDKGVPFNESLWKKPREVLAITGALMAFKKEGFEKLGGFSTRYVYGHYEDADLSLRWAARIGKVMIHPLLRIVHLEGQGSKYRGESYRGASMVNRYFFTARYTARYKEQFEAAVTRR